MHRPPTLYDRAARQSPQMGMNACRREQSCPAALVTPINAHSTLGSSKQRLFSISTGKGQETGVVLEAPAPWDAEGVERAGALEACWAA